MVFDVAVLLILAFLHGLFTLAEIGLGSSRRSRVAVEAEEGSAGAQKVLALLDSPSSYIPTLQLGSSLLAILMGVYAGAEFQVPFRDVLIGFNFNTSNAELLSLCVVVAGITVLVVLVGELVPRRIAHNNPEQVAKACAPVLAFLLRFVGPFVGVLDASSRSFLKLLGLRDRPVNQQVTEEEVKIMIEQGAQSGVFDEAEEQILSQALRLPDRTASSMMTSRQAIEWIDVNDPIETIWEEVSSSAHSYFPLAEGTMDNVVGIIALKDLARALLSGRPVDVRAIMKLPLLIPSTASALTILDRFREEKTHVALVVDEFGGLDGMLTTKDLAEALFGDMSFEDQYTEPSLVQRQDGSLLIDATMEVDELLGQLSLTRSEDQRKRGYHSVGGFIMEQLGHIPTVGERFLYGDYWFEVVDMDRLRIDKILVTQAVEELKLTEPR